jgi:pimeloyl-ACP methyl ester carboxylesterase
VSMKSGKGRDAIRAGCGVLLCLVGFLLARATPFRETTVIVDAGGCRLVTDIVDAGEDETQGSVILLHGLAANKKIMSYLARGFALLNVRVFVPDMPGHGRTRGPFSYARADACSESLVRQLISRRAIDPTRTILAGHSMGGAIAMRVASRVQVAGTIAISPAPMATTYGVPASMLLFNDPAPAPPNTLILSESLASPKVRDTNRSLIAGAAAASGKFLVIPRSTHVSLLFDREAVRVSQAWVAQILKFEAKPGVPSRLPLAGAFAGLAGILLLAGPFLRETLGVRSIPASVDPKVPTETTTPVIVEEPRSPIISPSVGRVLLEVAGVSLVIVGVLQVAPHGSQLFAFFHVFEGDYLAGFLLVVGVILLLVHRKDLGIFAQWKPVPLLATVFAAIILPVLIYSWLDLTVTEAWLTPSRWLRLPALFVAVVPYHAAEELLLGSLRARPGKIRLVLGLAIRLSVWVALFLGVFVLHNGEILLVLLAPYLATFCLLQRSGTDVVRKGTGSPIAAAIFGAILLAGFCVVVFPIT